MCSESSAMLGFWFGSHLGKRVAGLFSHIYTSTQVSRDITLGNLKVRKKVRKKERGRKGERE